MCLWGLYYVTTKLVNCNFITRPETTTNLPSYLTENGGLLLSDRNHRTEKVYIDNLCFFWALVLHDGCNPKKLERDAKHYYVRYHEAFPKKKKIVVSSVQNFST